MSNTVSASLPYYMPDNNPKYLVCWALPTTWARPAGWLFDTFSFLKLFECRFRLLAGGVRMRKDFSLFRNISEVWSCQPEWHTFQRISVLRIFAWVTFQTGSYSVRMEKDFSLFSKHKWSVVSENAWLTRMTGDTLFKRRVGVLWQSKSSAKGN